MRLPYIENAYIPEAKIVEYLLNLEHTDGGGDKAVFFMRFGFALERWTELRDALLRHASMYEVVEGLQTPHGINYVVEGRLETPDGRNPAVRTVWIVQPDSTTPRFVTAYPL